MTQNSHVVPSPMLDGGVLMEFVCGSVVCYVIGCGDLGFAYRVFPFVVSILMRSFIACVMQDMFIVHMFYTDRGFVYTHGALPQCLKR